MTSDDRISSIERLRKLGPVFSLADIQANFGFTRDMSKQYAANWANRNLSKRFGGGVYFNLIKDLDGPQTRVAEALDKLLRVPVIAVGGYALHAGGWTTQIHRRMEIVVPVMRGSLTAPATEGDVILTPRYLTWYRALTASTDMSAGGIPVAAPEFALADALLSSKRSLSSKRPVSAPPPDEIDMGNFDEAALQSVRDAMRALGGSVEEVEELTEPYEAAVTEAGDVISF